ncbi:MAG: hypothetical protein AAFU79_10605 [Myxococcota bacterium]
MSGAAVLTLLLATPLTITPPTEGTLRIHRAQIVVAREDAMDTWTWRFQVSGRGRASFRLEGDPTEAGPSVTDMDRLDHATAPRFVVHQAWDPCAFGVGRYGRHFPPTREFSWPYGPQAWSEQWPRIERALDTLAAERTMRAEPAPATTLRVELSGRAGWTPPLSVKRPKRQTLELRPLGPLAPPGQDVDVDLFLSGLVPAEPTGVTPLPTLLSLPEVAFETPEDILRAAVRQRQQLEQEAEWVLVYAAGPSESEPWRRFGCSVRRTGELSVDLETPGQPTQLQPTWLIHRPWRASLSCDARQAYLLAVAKHQLRVHQVYAALTGRRLEVVVGLSRDRGYLVEPFGDPARIAHTVDQLPRVEIDRSRW